MSAVALTAAQALVRFLRAQYTERDGERQRAIPAMFGILGHGNALGLGEALATLDGGLPLHQPKHEQAMVHTALGFAKARRRLATLACTTSIGPGATNLVTGAATATTNRLPVLLLPADTFASRRQGPVLQQLQHPSYRDWSINESLRAVSRFYDRITRPEQLLDALPEAMRVLFDPAQTGAVTLALSQDVLGEAWDVPEAFLAERTWAVARRPPERGAVAAAAALLHSARQPLVIAGGGVRYSAAEEALGRLLDAHGLPVAETSAGKGVARGGLPLGGIGVNGTGAAAAVAERADAVLCVGTRLSDFTTASRSLFQAEAVRFAAVNVDAADAQALGAIPVVADARTALAALDGELGTWETGAAYREDVADALRRWHDLVAAEVRPRADERMSQGEALRVLNARARAGDWLVAAAGSPPGDVLKLWGPQPGAAVHVEFGFSCMGHELPAALGIRIAEPDAGQIVALIGDGTYLMAPTELVTAVELGLAVTTVVLVNSGYRSIEGLQRGVLGRGFGNVFAAEVDYAANARSLGCVAWEARTPDELARALEEARAVRDGPTLIACHVEPRRALPPSGAWWDLGVPQLSSDPRIASLASAHAEGAARQRFHG